MLRSAMFGSCLVALAGGIGCKGPNRSTSSVKIVAGQDAAGSDVAKSTVALVIGSGQGTELCSATLIGPNQLVTAAHCVDGQQPQNIKVVFGLSADPTQNETRQVTGAARHPAFDNFGQGSGQGGQGPQVGGPPADGAGLGFGLGELPSAFSLAAGDGQPTGTDQGTGTGKPMGDIGIVVFDQPAPQAYQPVTVGSPDSVTPGAPIVLAGFGATAQSQVGAGSLRTTTAKIDHVCTANGGTDQDTGCGLREFVQAVENRGGTCNGDSGGPVFIQGQNGLQVVGATSRGSDCDKGNGTYTFVSQYQGWMKCTFAKLGQALPTLADDASAAECNQTQTQGGSQTGNQGNPTAGTGA